MPTSKTRRNARRHKGPTPPRGGRRSSQTFPPVYAELLNAMGAADVSMLAQFLASGSNRSAPPSRRRPRREEAVTYRARVEIAGSDPRIWRRIELTSDLTLDNVHDLLQAVMGWSDDHLHQFGSGEDLYGPDTERYLMPFSIGEGAVGIDEGTVHLDEVLVEPGDRLWYEYDFGDSWAHIIELEEVLDPVPGAPAARCLAGGGACPPEDCGGIWGYANLLEVLAGPPGPERDELYEWVGSDFDPASFDPDRVNAALAGSRLSVASCLPAGIDPQTPLGDLIEGMGGEVPTRIAAALDALVTFAPEVSAADRARTVRPYSLLLDRIGHDGVPLTQAGYLPPALVQQLAADLGVHTRWIGTNNREAQTLPVLEFRESAQHVGLLRKSHNRISLTKAGRRALDDPEFLWQHISGALPLSAGLRRPEATAARTAGSLLLLATAAGLCRTERDELLVSGVAARGRHSGPGSPLTASGVRQSARPTWIVLEFMRVLPSWLYGPPDADSPVPATGIAFARSALGLG